MCLVNTVLKAIGGLPGTMVVAGAMLQSSCHCLSARITS